jgi:beta-lactamase regulating signal transducer with metallopeptidase domain
MDILNTLLEITIYSGVIFTAVMLLKKALRDKMSPMLHYAVWALLILRLLVPATIASPVHLFVIPAETQNNAAGQQMQPQANQPFDYRAKDDRRYAG